MSVVTRSLQAGVVLAVCAAGAAFASPAVAVVRPDLAMAACLQGTGATTTRLHLDPQSPGVSVGVPNTALQFQFGEGAVVRVTATGRISYGGVFNWRGTWGPAGNGQTAPATAAWPYPSGPDAALVGRWNQTGGNQPIGTDSGCLYVPTSTNPATPYGLGLRSNDDWILDNGDVGYDITVSAWRYYT